MTLDGKLLSGKEVPLIEDGLAHQVNVLMG